MAFPCYDLPMFRRVFWKGLLWSTGLTWFFNYDPCFLDYLLFIVPGILLRDLLERERSPGRSSEYPNPS